jgi:curli biogenesis system outer membrane secretion channel CsgG
MKFCRLLSCLCLLFFCFACATAGQKYISVQYIGAAAEPANTQVGIAGFKDLRQDTLQGYVGHRILLDNSQETYFVGNMDLAQSLTDAAASFLETRRYAIQKTAAWDPTPDGLARVSPSLPYLITGAIRQFECRAQKKGGHTTMTLDISLDLFLGIPARQAVKTIPVSFALEKTVMTFTREEFEGFVNDSVAEIFEKALIIDG